MSKKIAVGSPWRFILPTKGPYYTSGRVYVVASEADDGGMFRVHDNISANHNWTARAFMEAFVPAEDETALPVRTRTVTEIVPGIYGSIMVSEPGDYAVFIRMHIEDHGKFYSAKELREAGRLFKSLAEALEETS